jgi:putative phosphoribosyl transferase
MTPDASAGTAVSRLQVALPVGPGLSGDLAVPATAAGVAIFAHGSGSSRFSPRNRFVAAELHRRGIATLLFDLLTPDEESDRANVFDVALLGGRLVQATRWVLEQPPVRGLCPGFFGASTGAAAALLAAAELGPLVCALVSRGGRPDLAAPRLAQVQAPTLLIVGSRDEVVLELNRQAFARLTCERRLAVVQGASHLFEEPGTLERVAELAGDWLAVHLAGAPARATAASAVELVDPLSS